MGLSILGLVSPFDGGVSSGMHLARLVFGDGIVTGVALFDWQLC